MANIEGFYAKKDGLTLQVCCSPFRNGGGDYVIFRGAMHPMRWITCDLVSRSDFVTTVGAPAPPRREAFTIDWCYGKNTVFELSFNNEASSSGRESNRGEGSHHCGMLIENKTHEFSRVLQPRPGTYRLPLLKWKKPHQQIQQTVEGKQLKEKIQISAEGGVASAETSSSGLNLSVSPGPLAMKPVLEPTEHHSDSLYFRQAELNFGAKYGLKHQGYYCFHDVLPNEAVSSALSAPEVRDALCQSAQSKSHTSVSSSNPAILSLCAPLIEAVTELLGCEFEPPHNGQIAVQPPCSSSSGGTEPSPVPDATLPTAHIDGLYTPTNGVEEGKLGSFTLIIGVALTDVLQPNSGNFTVFPGSHVLLVDAAKNRGVPIHADRNRCVNTCMYEAFGKSSNHGQLLPDFQGINPAQICCRKGSLYVALYGTAHQVSTNMTQQPRVAVYFRITHPGRDWNKEGQDRMVPCLDPMSELPGLKDV